MKLRVSTNNFYVGNKRPKEDALLMASEGCDISGIQEAYGGNRYVIRKTLSKTHEVFSRKSKNKDKHMAFTEVPVVYRKRLKVIKTWARLISKRSQKKNIGMPRAATAVRFEKDGYTVTFINTHCNAAVQNRQTKQPLSRRIRRVSEFVKGMIILEAMIRNAKRRGDLVVLVGDLNFRTTTRKPWYFSPQSVFKRTGLKYRNDGLDYIAFSRKFRASNYKVTPPFRTGSDHPWLFLTLEV